MTLNNLMMSGLGLMILSLVGCSSLSGLPRDVKRECTFDQQMQGLRFEKLNEIPPALDASLKSFTANHIEGFDFSRELSTYALTDQFGNYRIYWYNEIVKEHGEYVRADFTEDGIFIGWRGRFSYDQDEHKDEETFMDAEGNHIFQLGEYPLKIADGAKRIGFSRSSRKTFSTKQTKVVLSHETLFVNGLSYGQLDDGDEIFVDHGTVFIREKRKVGSIPNEEEWRWLHPVQWIADSKYLNDRLVFFCWKDSMASGKTLSGREWIEIENVRVEFKKDALFVNKEFCHQLTASDIVLLFRGEVFLLNEDLRHKASISNRELDEALSAGGRIKRVWPDKADVVIRDRIW